MEQLNLQVTLNNDGSITARWSAVSNVVRYDAYIQRVGQSVLVCRDSNLHTTSYTSPAGLAANAQYNVSVIAYLSPSGNVSDGKRILIPLDFYDNQPLGVPKNVKAVAGTNYVTVSYDAVGGARSYDILFDNQVTNVTSTSRQFSGLKPKTSHTYAVRAKNTKQTGSYSPTYSVQTLQVTPAVPSGIRKTATETSAVISWNEVYGATSYDIQFDGRTYNTTALTKTFTGLRAGTAYSFQIRAKNPDIASAYTSSYTVTTPPGAPAGLTAESTYNTVTVKWNKTAGAAEYMIRFNGRDVRVSSSSSSYLFSGLTPKTSYTYQMCCKSVDGAGSFSAARTIRTQPKLPAAPSGIVKSSTENSVKLKWDKISDATGYEVLFGGKRYIVSGNEKDFTSLSANTEYSYQIRGKNADGTGPYSALQTVRTTPVAPSVSALTVTVNEYSATVGWTAVSGATSYDLLFNGQVYGGSAVSRTVNRLTADTNYSLQLRVRNADGASSYSGARTIRTAPMPPSQIQASARADSVTVGWNAVSGAYSYDLLLNDIIYHTVDLYKTVSGLTASTSYQYRIRSNGRGGSSTYSGTRTVSTLPNPPAVPANVQAGSTVNSVTVSWNAAAGASGYELMLNNKTYETTRTSYTVGGLTPNTGYSYRVRAKNAGGTSAYSEYRTVKTLMAPPEVPVGVTAQATSSSVTVSWSAAWDAASYEVLFNGTVYSTTATSRTFTGLSANTSYRYQVRAKNAGGVSAYCSAGTVRTLVAPPASPDNVKITATGTSVTVSWDAVPGATGYDILFDGTVYRATTTSQMFTGLLEGTGYTCQVCARNAGGSSPFTAEYMVPTIPPIPVQVRADVTADTVTLEWDACRGADGYRVRFDGSDFDVEETRKQFTGLAANTRHSYSVSAKNRSGMSAFGGAADIRTLLQTPLGILAVPEPESVEICWHKVDDATGYDVEFDGKVYSVTETSRVFTGLKPLTEHTYAVRAKNASVVSEYSRTKKVITLSGLPDVPAGIRAEATMNSITVSWYQSEDATGYEVAFDEPVAETDVVSVQSDETETEGMRRLSARRTRRKRLSRTYSDLCPGTLHTFCVRAYNKYGYGDYSRLRKVWTLGSIHSGMPGMGRRRTYADGRRAHTALEPVNAMTGAFLWSYPFVPGSGRDGLELTLMYDSGRDVSCAALGRGWTYNYCYQLTHAGEYFFFSTPYGDGAAFREEGETGVCLPVDESQPLRLEKAADGGWTVKDTDGTAYEFDGSLHLRAIVENGLTVCRFYTDENGQTARIEGRHGGSLELSYADGRLCAAADEAGNTAAFTFTEGMLAGAANPLGDGMSFAYDAEGLLSKITDFGGNVYLTNEYDENGRVAVQSLAGRGASAAVYDETERTAAFTDEAGNETKYYYDEAGHVTKVELSGASMQCSYNVNGQITQQIDALGNQTRMEYDAAGRMNRVTHPDGTSEQAIYNDRNLPVKVVNRDGTESLFAYDERNNLLSVQDERGNTCTYAYDADDNLTAYTDKEGGVWRYTYDANGCLSGACDPEGNTYGYTHDSAGRLLSYTTPGGSVTSYTYSAAGDLLQITDADGSRTFTYDANGSRTGLTDRMGNSRRMEYNAMGQVTLATDFLGKAYTFEYDVRGNRIRETDPLGHSVSYTYDAHGSQTGKTDANGGETNYAYDAAGRLVQIKDAAGGIVSYTYDTMGQVSAVTDPLAHQISYTYDRAGHVVRETDALGHSVQYTYDAAGNMLTRTDEDGNVVSYTYDRENRLQSICTDAGTTTFSYDGLGRIVCVTDTDGCTETAQYDADGNVTVSADQENHQTLYDYDRMGRMVQETAPDGGITSYAYDKNGNCICITDAEGYTRTYAYDAEGRLLKEADPAGHETAYTYDDKGQLLCVTDAGGGVTAYAYDGNGNLVRETNPLGGESVYTYDSLNRLITSKDAAGNTCSYTYDAAGNKISFTDANGNSHTYTYDACNRLTGVADGGENRLTLAYTAAGKVCSATDGEGAETDYQYDALGRLTRIADALGHSVSFTYDSSDRMRSRTDALGNTTTYTYSPSGRLLRVEDAEGGVTAYTYDAAGHILTREDPAGGVTSYAYDLLGRVTSLTDALGNTTEFTYTADGRIASVKDAQGNVTQYTYDACGNLSGIQDPLGNTVRYEYDAMNNRIKECLTASGEQRCATLYQYDKKGRMIREINPLLEEKVYTYDGNDNPVSCLDEEQRETVVCYDLNNQPLSMTYSDGRTASFRYNKRGELVEMQDWNGTLSLQRDQIGRLTKVTDHNGRTTAYTYDAADRRTAITYPGGSTAAYAYDKNGRLVEVTEGAATAAQYAYDPAGRVLSMTRPGGNVSYTYNPAGQPVKAAYRFGTATAEETFAYDKTGRLTALVRTPGAQEAPDPAAGADPDAAAAAQRSAVLQSFTGNTQYAYDAAGRLTAYNENGMTETYTYDACGNRTARSLDGVLKTSYQYNALNQLTAMTEDGVPYRFAYDKCGSLTQQWQADNLIRRYTYDTAGRMIRGENLQTGAQTDYAYNALHMRIQNVQKYTGADGQRTRQRCYVPDLLSAADNDLMVYETGANTTRSLYGHAYELLCASTIPPQTAADIHGDTLPAADATPQTERATYFQPDRYGSPLFAADAQGDNLRAIPRNIWGAHRTPTNGQSPQDDTDCPFTSYTYDPVLGQYFARARFYDPACGRMLSKDPVKRGLNPYPYCDNDPANYTDPTGEVANILAGGIVGGTIGFAWGFAGSALSQRMSGRRVDWRRAAGAGINGAVIGAVRGAMTASGVGAAAAFAGNFAAGTAGSALEQWIGPGNVSARRSVAGGLINASSSLWYGNKGFKNAGQALSRGFGAGATRSGIEYLAETLGRPSGTGERNSLRNRYERGYGSSASGNRDPRRGCGSTRPSQSTLGYTSASGYRYRTLESGKSRRNSFSLSGLLKTMAFGGVMEGLGNLAFFEAGRAVEALKRSVLSRGNNVIIIHNDILDSPRTGSALTIDEINPIYKINPKTGKDYIAQEFPARPQAHGFTDIVDNYAGYATRTSINNATLYQLESSLNGVSGRFEWIIQDGQVTHRMFIQNGTMNGVPIKP